MPGIPSHFTYRYKPGQGAKLDLSHPQLRGCYAWWTSREGAGSTIREGINRYNATTSNTPLWSPTKHGIANTGNSTAWVTVSISHPNWSAGDYSVVVDIIAGTPTTWNPVWSNGNFVPCIYTQAASTSNPWAVYRNSTALANTVLVAGNRYQLVYVNDFTNTTYSMYLNGQPDGTRSTNAVLTDPAVQRLHDDSSGLGNNSLIQGRLYSRALSPAEIMDIYVNPWAPFSRQLPVWFSSGAAPAWNNSINEISAPASVNEITNANIQSINEI